MTASAGDELNTRSARGSCTSTTAEKRLLSSSRSGTRFSRAVLDVSSSTRASIVCAPAVVNVRFVVSVTGVFTVENGPAVLR